MVKNKVTAIKLLRRSHSQYGAYIKPAIVALPVD
jgi:hypothetical protein